MLKKVLVEGPVLTKSGYGEHSRFVLRALRARKDLQVYINPLEWGKTSWLWEDTEERRWIDERIIETMKLANSQKIPLDVQIHVGIPLEFEKKAPYSVCVTAGIETTKLARSWIEKCEGIDKIIVPSEHAKWGFENSRYMDVDDSTGEQKTISCKSPISVVPYPVKTTKSESNFGLQLETKFNFLVVAQWSARKNLSSTIEWFLEEFSSNDDVGLVVKCCFGRNSRIDFEDTSKLFDKISRKFQDKKCSLYLLHGDMSEEEMVALYEHRDIKAIISATHGEGFGLPLFEAAYSGLPVAAPSWSGHIDFLYITDKSGNTKPMFADIDYDILPVQEEAVWEEIVIKDSMWCFPKKESFQEKIRSMYTNYPMYKSRAKKLKKHILEQYEESTILKKFSEELVEEVDLPECDYVFVSDAFVHQYAGGAELSLQSLISSAPGAPLGFNSTTINREIIDHYRDKAWVFGNIATINPELLSYIPQSGIKYSFVEFDYKYCKYRNPALYSMVEGEECSYNTTPLAQMVQNFMLGAESVFYMSEEQRSLFREHLPATSMCNDHVLSSIFDDEVLDYILALRKKFIDKKDNKWIVYGSDSWVKGVSESESWCKENNLEYEIIADLAYSQFLEKMAKSKGLCFLPTGLDTCPRMIIEAKLLGCELKINEKVQHANEEWFNMELDDQIEYLRSRKRAFWDNAF